MNRSAEVRVGVDAFSAKVRGTSNRNRIEEVIVGTAESFTQSGFAQFISSQAGRYLRIVVGIAIIAWGYSERTQTMGVVLIVVGLIPLVAGTLNLCLISALLGGPISGARILKSKPKS
jgi:Inner membrane protein YgaP-like, transmembrane domain